MGAVDFKTMGVKLTLRCRYHVSTFLHQGFNEVRVGFKFLLINSDNIPEVGGIHEAVYVLQRRQTHTRRGAHSPGLAVNTSQGR